MGGFLLALVLEMFMLDMWPDRLEKVGDALAVLRAHSNGLA
jgi:hypothetical protein